jgi:hypothetical protein
MSALMSVSSSLPSTLKKFFASVKVIGSLAAGVTTEYAIT